MRFRRTVIIVLVIAAVGFSIAIGNAADSVANGGSMAEPSGAQQEWSLDAAVVSSANLALIKYAGLPPVPKQALEPQAYAIATVRRASLARVIESDPRQALLLSLAPLERQGLPKRVSALLEERLHARGDLTREVTEDPPGDTAPDPQEVAPVSVTSWTARIGQRTWQAFVYGLRQRHQTKFDSPIHGIALDDLMAVSESPLYQYDPFETLQLGFQPGEIVATDGDIPLVLPDTKAYIDLRDDLLSDILRFGPIPTTKPDTWTTGVKRILVLKASFLGEVDDPATPGDDRLTPHTDGEIFNALFGADTFFSTNSQRLTAFDPVIVHTPVEVLAASVYTGASGEVVGRALLEEHVLNNARIAGHDPDEYDRVIILARRLFASGSAHGDVGGKVVMVVGESPSLVVTVTHELGHTYGFDHSTFYAPLTPDPIGPGEHQEYGDAWDIMGSPNAETEGHWLSRHFNVFFKHLAGWLPDLAVVDGTAGGDFRMRRHDSSSAEGLRAIFIRAGDGTTYWLDVRRSFPSNVSMMRGVEVRRDINDPAYFYGPLRLLDMDTVTPGGPGVLYHSLTTGRMFHDIGNGLTIHTVHVGEDELGEYTRVVISR